MFFRYNNRIYGGPTAVDVVRAIIEDTSADAGREVAVKEFLDQSLADMEDQIPLRELDVSSTLSDETVAFNYLCLLDDYELGKLYDGVAIRASRQRAQHDVTA